MKQQTWQPSFVFALLTNIMIFLVGLITVPSGLGQLNISDIEACQVLQINAFWFLGRQIPLWAGFLLFEMYTRKKM